MDRGQGLEPRQSDSKSDVLPLNYPRMIGTHGRIRTDTSVNFESTASTSWATWAYEFKTQHVPDCTRIHSNRFHAMYQ